MAEINPSKTIVVSYDMYTEFEGERELVEQATAEQPFQFTTGLGFTFEAFEEKFKDLKEGDTFNFTLTKEETNGDRRARSSISRPKRIKAMMTLDASKYT